MTHDKLQYLSHSWLWNEHPELRYLAHANFNNLTSQNKDAIKIMARMKSIGLVRGVLDYEFYYRGVLHAFDFKIGSDKLSKHQKEYINAIESQGGKGHEIRSLEQFQEVIKDILKGRYND